MNVLVCGANGFIGRHLCAALAAAGHRVLRGVRTAKAGDDVAIDYLRDRSSHDWLPRLHGVDAVVNAVGILHEAPGKTFDAIHRDAPNALFDACGQAGVKHVIQISALGGRSDDHLTPYMRTKRAADAHLMRKDLDWVIVRPSLVVGADGESSRLFRALASLPVIGLPGRGQQPLQPVHIDDLSQAIVQLLRPGAPARAVVNAVGPQPMTYQGMLAAYRDAMALPAPLWLPIPLPLMHVLTRVAALLPQHVLSEDTLHMLEQGNAADPAAFAQLLGRAPKGSHDWFAGQTPSMLRADAIAAWMLPLFRVALAIVWLVTAALSLGLYPVADSRAMLAQVGLHGWFADVALYGAALLDAALGIATLLAPGRLLWRLQMLLIAGYTVIISIFLPAYWLHPFGPVLKNIPILAMLFVLDASQPKRRD